MKFISKPSSPQLYILDSIRFDQHPDKDDTDAVEREENTWVDTDGILHGQVRLIIGADLLVCSNDAELVAETIESALMEGGRAGKRILSYCTYEYPDLLIIHLTLQKSFWEQVPINVSV